MTEKFPSSEFRKCNITKKEQMSKNFAYLVVVEFENIKCKYYNNFISSSKCTEVYNAEYDNGRIMKAEKLTITLTDIDFDFLTKAYKYDKYTIKECYFSVYDYLPKKFINFVLDKYVKKTSYKNVEGMEVEYAKEKNKFNALYGMSVTNNIRDEVEYDTINDWKERELTNEEIQKKLLEEKKQGFLSFAYGVWVTAYARRNLLENVVKLDEYVIYCDTDSIKLREGFDKKVIEDYNRSVIEKIKNVSEILEIDFEKFCPVDKFGEKHLLGVFDNDGEYEEFVTQGAKKYATTKLIDEKKKKENMNIIEEKDGKIKILEITVAGVPKTRGFGTKKYRRI